MARPGTAAVVVIGGAALVAGFFLFQSVLGSGGEAGGEVASDAPVSSSDQGGSEPDEAGSVSDETSSGSDPDDYDCPASVADQLESQVYVLAKVEFEVSGFGPGNTWVWRPGLCGGVDVEDVLVLEGNAGQCTLPSPDLAGFLGARVAGNEVNPAAIFGDRSFQAAVRVSQREFISLGHNSEFDITTGGLSFGAAQGASRDDRGEQWITEGGTMTSTATDASGENDESDDPEGSYFVIFEGIGEVELSVGEFKATWTGRAIDDHSGAEANGRVVVTCTYLYLPR